MKHLLRRAIQTLLMAILLFSSAPVLAAEPGKWSGIDETIVERFAEEFGRRARAPLIDTDQGDLLLFLFTLAGAVGGFVTGYTWHKLFVAGKKSSGVE